MTKLENKNTKLWDKGEFREKYERKIENIPIHSSDKLYDFCVEGRPCRLCHFWDQEKIICMIMEEIKLVLKSEM